MYRLEVRETGKGKILNVFLYKNVVRRWEPMPKQETSPEKKTLFFYFSPSILQSLQVRFVIYLCIAC